MPRECGEDLLRAARSGRQRHKVNSVRQVAPGSTSNRVNNFASGGHAINHQNNTAPPMAKSQQEESGAVGPEPVGTMPTGAGGGA